MKLKYKHRKAEFEEQLRMGDELNKEILPYMIYLVTNNAQNLLFFVQTKKTMHNNCAQIKPFAQNIIFFVQTKETMHKLSSYIKYYAQIFAKLIVLEIKFEEELRGEAVLNLRIVNNLNSIISNE